MAVPEDVRHRQQHSIEDLYLQAMYPEDLPFTLPELQKRTQQEARHRNKLTSGRDQEQLPAPQHKQQPQKGGHEGQKGRNMPREKERRRRGEDLAFLPTDVRISQAKAMARVVNKGPAPPTSLIAPSSRRPSTTPALVSYPLPSPPPPSRSGRTM